jgi:hypothetical protein
MSELAARGKALVEGKYAGDRFGTNGAEGVADAPRDWDYQETDENVYDENVYDESEDAGEPTTWEPVELGPWLRGEVEQPQPSIGVRRSDGLQLIYPGREHAIVGETESGKTWLALACVAPELLAGNTVVYIHYEEGDPTSTIERLQVLGINQSVIAAQLRFIAPTRHARTEWITDLLTPAPTLVVHDGVNEAMSLIGAEIKDVDGAATFRRQLVKPFLRVGAASIACDHMPMVRDGSRRDAYGSVHKGNALDGARIALENVEPFGRRMRGVSHVYVTKDRPGQLRSRGRATKTPGKTLIGTLVVDDEDSFEPCSLMFYAPRDDNEGPEGQQCGVTLVELHEIVYQVVAALPDRTVGSQRQLFAAMRQAGQPFREGSIRMAVDDLLLVGRLVEVPGKRGATGYQAVSTAARTAAQEEAR